VNFSFASENFERAQTVLADFTRKTQGRRVVMRWKIKVDEDGFKKWVAWVSHGRRYQVYEDGLTDQFRVAYLDHNYGWHVLEGTWPTKTEAQAAAEAHNNKKIAEGAA
jgi:hypothetical protein